MRIVLGDKTNMGNIASQMVYSQGQQQFSNPGDAFEALSFKPIDETIKFLKDKPQSYIQQLKLEAECLESDDDYFMFFKRFPYPIEEKSSQREIKLPYFEFLHHRLPNASIGLRPKGKRYAPNVIPDLKSGRWSQEPSPTKRDSRVQTSARRRLCTIPKRLAQPCIAFVMKPCSVVGKRVQGLERVDRKGAFSYKSSTISR